MFRKELEEKGYDVYTLDFAVKTLMEYMEKNGKDIKQC